MKRDKSIIVVFCCIIFSLIQFPKAVLAETNIIDYKYSQYDVEDKNIKKFLFEIGESPEDTNNILKQYPQMLEILNNNCENITYSYDVHSSNDEYVNKNLKELEINEIMPNAEYYIEAFASPSYKKVIVSRIYGSQFDIPQSIYYDQDGYVGYLPLTYIEKDKELPRYTAVFGGMVVKKGPGVR